MKKLLTLLSILLLTSQTKVLNNKIERPENREIENRKELIFASRGALILPHSVVIGELSDYSSLESDLFKVISRTLDFMKEGKSPDTLVEEFDFLYKLYIQEDILNNEKVNEWRIGKGFRSSDRAEYRVELLTSDTSINGYIFLIKNESWKVIDIQLEKDLKRVLDPSQPILY